MIIRRKFYMNSFNNEKKLTLNYIVVDRCNQRMEIIKTSKKVRTFVQAEALLNKLVTSRNKLTTKMRS